MNNWSNFEFLRRVGRILADRGPDFRMRGADVVRVDGRWVIWPDSAQHAADEDIRVYDSLAELEEGEVQS